jgi:large subunit ribosomal protein L30
MADLKITLVRSPIGRKPKHRLTVQALGLRKMGATVIQQDNPAIRGMVHQVGYLLKVEESTEKAVAAKPVAKEAEKPAAPAKPAAEKPAKAEKPAAAKPAVKKAADKPAAPKKAKKEASA